MKHSSKSRAKPKPLNSELEFTFDAIGTKWSIVFLAAVDAESLTKIKRIILQRVHEFDATYSRFKPTSWLMQISQTPGTYDLPANAPPLFDLYETLYALSDGAVTPMIGSTLAQAGYDADYSLIPKAPLEAPPTWQEALDYSRGKLTVKRPIGLDVGAAGKGYLVDIVAGCMRDFGIKDFIIDAGGDILHASQSGTPVQIGLENPDNPQEILGVATLNNRSICGSAGHRRAWAGYNHILDPRTLTSPTAIKAVWIVADNTLIADGLSTAIYFTPPVKLQSRFNFEYAIVNDDNSLQVSAQFPAEFFTVQGSR